jgi:mannose-6-phosphate isomerase-like protein (cupin superfamily)
VFTQVLKDANAAVLRQLQQWVHTHLREDELWYVIDGDFRFKAGDAMLRVSAGGMAFGPRGLPHAFQNIGDAPGRLLVITTPSGPERFFEEFAALLPAQLVRRR